MNNSYYVAINLVTGLALITKSKTAISKHLNISLRTVQRRIEEIGEIGISVKEGYIISSRIEIHRQRKGGNRSTKRIKYQEMLSKAAKMVSEQLDYERFSS